MASPTQRRVFVGLRPPEELAERIQKQVDALREPGWRTYAAEDLHITLAFLGHVSEERVDLLKRVLPEELRGVRSPDLRLSGLDAFPSRSAPRVLWLAVEDQGNDAATLFSLETRAKGAAMAVGWRPPRAERERGFVPHLTVARLAEDAAPPAASAWTLGFAQSWAPVEVFLFESLPRVREGAPRYRALASVPLVMGPG